MKKEIIIGLMLVILTLGIAFLPEIVEKFDKENIGTLNPYKQYNPEFLAQHPKGDTFSTLITGEEMSMLTVKEVAKIWEIDENEFLAKLNKEFRKSNTLNSKIGDFFFGKQGQAPKRVKIIADSLI